MVCPGPEDRRERRATWALATTAPKVSPAPWDPPESPVPLAAARLSAIKEWASSDHRAYRETEGHRENPAQAEYQALMDPQDYQV